MHAAVARSGKLYVEDVPEPVPAAGEALCAVRACGICGSDLHMLTHAEAVRTMGDALGAPSAFDPTADFVMGHEYAVEVLELGPDTDGAPVRPGDLAVCIPVALTAGGIEPIGYSNTYNGAYADRLCITAAIALPVPNGLDARRASLTEPMAVGVHAVNRSRIAPGEGALVLGCGPIGLAVVAALRARGIEPVVAADYSSRRRALAAALGAHVVVDPAVEPAVDAWRRTGGSRTLVVFEAVGVPGMLEAAMKDAPPQSRITVVGVCMEADTVYPMVGVLKELNIQFSFGYDPIEFAGTLRSIAEGDIDVTPMITGVVGVGGVPAAFEALARPEEHVKIVVEPGAPERITTP